MARLVIVGMLALAAILPGEALLVCAGLAPLGRPLAAVTGASVPLGEALVLAFLGGWLLHETARVPRSTSGNRALVIPALLVAATVAASCAVQVSALEAYAGGPWALIARIGTFLTFEYFPDPRRFPSITAAALFLEGVGLYVSAATLGRRDSSFGLRLMLATVAGGAGVAAFNMSRLVELWLRSGTSLTELVALPTMSRTSSAFPDVNAAGSYLAMVLLMSGAVAIGRRPRAGWIVTTFVIAAAFWMTGSRAAFVAVPAAVTLVLAARGSRRRRAWIWPSVAGAVALVLLVAALAQVSRTANRDLSGAVSRRLELTRAGLRMFATHPLFGIGVGRYSSLSDEFSSPDLRRLLPRENAHNNFLQILTELGLVGFIAFVWLLLAIGRSSWRARTGSGMTPLALGTAAGIIAFLLTCLAGHPLLIPEVAYAFWLVLGLAVGLAQEPVPVTSPAGDGRRWSWRAVVAGTMVVILVVSVPVRTGQLISEGSIARPSEGLSEWQTDRDGTSFRWMTERAQFSILASARAVKLPLSLETSTNAVARTVEIYLDGQLVSRMALTGDTWHEFRCVVPPAPPGIHFRRIELRADSAGSRAGIADRSRVSVLPRIKVGRPTLMRPQG